MEEGATAAAYLPDDIVVDILARLPAKLLCRFKCVSRRWRSLISDPAHRARLAQTLSGFFFVSRAPAWRFAGLQSSVTPPGGPPPVDTSLSFLPPSCGEIKMLDSCNGLLLLRCSNERPRRPPPPFYVVCNPATREWVALPRPRYTPGQHAYCYEYEGNVVTWYAAVGFDPAVSSHFYVFQMVEVDYTTECYLEAVEIYSSETGAWIMSEMGRGDAYFGAFMHHMTYFNGSLHLTSDSDAVASVGAKGRSWRIIHVLRREEDHHHHGRAYIGHSQGHLLYVDDVPREDVLSIYVLEDQDSGEWALTRRVSKKDLLFEPWKNMMRPTYYKAGFHPNGDLIFFYDRTREKLIAYDMSRNDWRVVCTLGDFEHAHRAFFPYVPWYSRGLASPNSS
ncbi:hypothetical protein C2845_PM04G26750 [Panicum miliaceum]|uniref:F-box domain-containing protein n=1 Tax=Panicum miliaceum TaxID=4540 RepID=A0A3L6QV31_PANMI|nr:hypothetical protein C2845_PM04G26750 [Panicum miliaceum]